MKKPGQECGSCACYAPLVKQCRAHPPLAVAVQGNGGQVGAIGIWPATDTENWCGEWRPDTAQVN